MRKKTDYPQLDDELAAMCEGLIYISETDSGVRPIVGTRLRETSIAGYIEALGIENAERVEATSAEDFFDRLTKRRDWHGTRERELAGRWKALETSMNSVLTQLRVLRIGRVRIDIYVVGMTTDGRVAGIETRAVET